MVVKKIKKVFSEDTKDYNYRIDVSKTDDLEGKVKILKYDEYISLTNQIDSLSKHLAFLEKELLNKNREIADLKQKVKNEEHYAQIINELNKENNENVQKIQFMRDKTIKDTKQKIDNKNMIIANLEQKIKTEEHFAIIIRNLNQKNNENIQKIQIAKDKTIKELDHQHHEQLRKTFDEFNKDLKKYVAIHQLQNTALKQILKLGFIDSIKGKHKEIAKAQIKDLGENKEVKKITSEKNKK